MYKTASYKEKYAALKQWMPSIIDTVKKDLKNEHLKKDLLFVKQYLASKNINKVTTDELVEAYNAAIADDERGEQIAEFITARWLLKNSDIYDFFEQELSKISPEFTEIEELDLPQSEKIVTLSAQSFGAPHSYVFSVLNSVVFPEQVFHGLRDSAEKALKQSAEDHLVKEEQQSLEKIKESHKNELARVTDKFEKKLSGLEKKYIADTEGLKKQIAALQRRLHEKK